MPNGLGAIDLETAAPIIQNGLALAVGGGQRVAWEVSTPLGFIVTGAMWAGGLVGTFMLDGLGRAMAMGLADSAASVAGWILTEQFLLGAGARGAKGFMSRTDKIDRGRDGQDALNAADRANGYRQTATSQRHAA